MDHEGPSSATFGEYTGALRRRWWVLVLGAVIGLGLAAAYLLVAPKTYISTAAVRVDQIGTESDNTLEGARLNSGVNMDTEAQLVTSQAVSSRAKVNLQTTEIVGQLVQHVSVGVPANTNVLRISFTDNTAVGAQKGAEAYAKAYLENRRFTTSDFIDQQENALQQHINELENQKNNASPDEQAGLQASIDALQTRVALLQGAIEPGAVISEALVPNHPASPNTQLVLASGLAFGILLGLLGLLMLERSDGRVYDWRMLERRMNLAVLADIPGKPGKPAQVYSQHSSGAEAFGNVRNAILSNLGTEEPSTIVIASPNEGVGADVVAANIAVSLATAGHRTTLLVADESSDIATMLGIPAAEGLSEVLIGRNPLTSVTQPVPDHERLSVVTSGLELSSKIADLEGSGLGPVVSALQQRNQFVIVRTRPTDTSADAQFVGRHAKAAILAVEIGRTLRDSVEHAVRQWRLVGTAVPGAVTVPPLAEPAPAPPRAVTTS
jgi:succinoglycan biosynthesis transport protein ExoP